MYILEKDIKEFFFNKLIEKGLAPNDGDLTAIADIVFDYLIEIEVLDPEDIEEYEE